MIITVTPTIMSGTVVRWYKNEYAEETGREIMSASRERVMVTGGDVTNSENMAELISLMATAAGVMLDLRRGKDVSSLATHRRHLGSRELTPL